MNALLVVTIISGCVVGVLALDRCDRTTRAEEHKIAPPAPPPGPPCTHEICTERPMRLRCTSSGTYVCHTYEIDYQHHCVCDTWGPAPR